MYEVIPGILEKEWGEIERKIELVRPFAKAIHIDLLDGKFAPNTTFLDPKPFRKYSQEIFFELHMMVEEPILYVDPFGEVGFRRFLGHIEMLSDTKKFLQSAHRYGEAGLAIDGPTIIDPYSLPMHLADAMLVMTIKAGFSGQTFTPSSVETIRDIALHTDRVIEVDGGINDATILQAKEAGAARFVSTSFLFSGDPKEQYERLLHRLS